MVCQFQYVLDIPSDATIIYSVNNNSIKNNPITRSNLIITNNILDRYRFAA